MKCFNLNDLLGLQEAISDLSLILDASKDEVIFALRDSGLISQEEAGELKFSMTDDP